MTRQTVTLFQGEEQTALEALAAYATIGMNLDATINFSISEDPRDGQRYLTLALVPRGGVSSRNVLRNLGVALDNNPRVYTDTSGVVYINLETAEAYYAKRRG